MKKRAIQRSEPPSTGSPTNSSNGKTELALTPRELALVLIIRRLGNGFIQKITVRDGEPHFIDWRPTPDILPVGQQIDLSQPQQVTNLIATLLPIRADESQSSL